MNSEDKISKYLLEYTELTCIKQLKNLKDSKDLYKDDFIGSNDTENDKSFEKLEYNNYKIFSENSNVNIKLKDESFIELYNCFNLMKEHNFLIKRLIEFNEFNDSLSNGVWINMDFNWRLIILDYYFPMDENKEMLYTTTSDNSIWNNLIEKALAKSLGSYEEIKKFTFRELIYHITGISPNINKLENKFDSFNQIKTSINMGHIVSCYKTKEYSKGKFNEKIINNKHYIIDNYLENEINKGIILKCNEDLENYQSLIYNNDDKNYIKLSWEEFLEEFEFVSFLNTKCNFLNNIKIEDTNTSLVKLFLTQENKLTINFVQSSYDKEESKYGIQNWKQPEEEVLLENDSQKENQNEYNFIRSRKYKYVETSTHCISIFRLLSEYNMELIENFENSKCIEVKNYNFSPGEYLIYIESHWKYTDLLNTISLQINSYNEFDLQNISTNINIDSYLNSVLIFNKYFKNQNLENATDKVIFEINEVFISLKELKFEDKKFYLVDTNSEKPMKIKFILSNIKNIKVFPELNSKNEIIVNISNNKNEMIILNDLKESIEFKGFEFLDEEVFNNYGRILFDFKKYKNYNNFYYLNSEEIQEGCGGCNIF